MEAIRDTLFLGPSELILIKEKYPQCVTENVTNSNEIFQEYRIVIKGEEEYNYYDFLMDMRIAMSSTKFYYRLKTDKRFKDRVRDRIEQGTISE